MGGKPGLTIFFPCYNDAATIGSMIAEADIVAKKLTDNYEIIVIDDGSTDHSRELLLSLKGKYDHLRLIFHDKNRGYGAALKSGFYNAGKELIFYTDGDGQYDIFELHKLFPVMQEGVDVVNGYKIIRSDPLYRKIIGITYLWLMRLFFNFHIRDVDCDFRLIRRKVFDTVKLKHDSGVICLEMVKRLELAGYRFAEFPVHHYYRVAGRSQIFHPIRLMRIGLNMLKLWWQIMVRRDTPVNIAYRDGVSRNNPRRENIGKN